jgi:beta-lactamase regulating signal transducer with metallopeptidase domain
MAWAVYVPILASMLFGVGAARFGRGANPATMVRLLVLSAVLIACISAYSMFLLGCTLVGQLGFVAEVGHWSAKAVSVDDPVERSVAVVAIFALAAATIAAVRILGVRTLAFVRAYRLARELTPGKGLAVVHDVRPLAYALPGGVFVVSASLLRALTTLERKVLFAHEAAHCRHKHHYWRAVADICGCMNPFLRPVASTVHALTERWADEEAARSVGDRRATAAALVRTAELTRTWTTQPAMLALGGGNVADRVEALMADPPRTSYWRVAVLATLLAVVVVTAHIAGASLDSIFDAAASNSTGAA